MENKRSAGKAQSMAPESGTGNKTHRYYFRLDDEQNIRLRSMMEQADMKSRTDFIIYRLFGSEFRVRKIDTTRQQYYTKLSEFKRQFIGVATNYNQIVRKIHTTFGEKRAQYLIAQLDKDTLEMGRIFREILILTEQFEKEWSSE